MSGSKPPLLRGTKNRYNVVQKIGTMWYKKSGTKEEQLELGVTAIQNRKGVKKWMVALPLTLARWFGGSPIISGGSK
jgi:hypothetical protein